MIYSCGRKRICCGHKGVKVVELDWLVKEFRSCNDNVLFVNQRLMKIHKFCQNPTKDTESFSLHQETPINWGSIISIKQEITPKYMHTYIRHYPSKVQTEKRQWGKMCFSWHGFLWKQYPTKYCACNITWTFPFTCGWPHGRCKQSYSSTPMKNKIKQVTCWHQTALTPHTVPIFNTFLGRTLNFYKIPATIAPLWLTEEKACYSHPSSNTS